ncbi:type VI secretion system baseplate subunit TssF [Caballeronia sordidicola]|uniref:type VI secretion system baseplate subunit TssF n=1 Tax=Caballeronia sordidicola TaxID=196367 RepID=UPI00094EBC4B|nr:type VI secretion system baseplate subunit TssF [Caballeronia sordidicola]
MSENKTLKYYEAEMRYLREASKEFAQAHPEAARRLGLTNVGAPDENVERLFQGFAFLSARLREKLDDDMPEITEPIVSMLWPHMVRTIPSLAILECAPRRDRVGSNLVPAGVAVRSKPVGPAKTTCIYRTTRAVHVLPLTLTDASTSTRADGRSVVRIVFEPQRFDQHALGDLSCIRLYLHRARADASVLYAALTRDVSSITVCMPSVHDGRGQVARGLRIEASGFGPETRVWPDANPQCDGEQGLLEYFTFPEKFHFIDLCGFDSATVPVDEMHVEFEIVLSRPLPSDTRIDASNFRLHCTPVVNLFELDAEPIQTDAYEHDYRVRTPRAVGEHVEPYSALTVIAVDHRSAEKHHYVPFEEFRHRGGMLRHEAPERYFHTRNVLGPSGTREMWLALGGLAWDVPGSVPDDHITARVLANNGTLPRMELREAALTEPISALSGIEKVSNLTKPSVPAYPPETERYQWKVMSHFAANGLAMLDTVVLREVLSLYNWTRDEQNQRRIDAVHDVRLRTLQRLGRNRLERGVEIEVSLHSGGFLGAGDVALFSDVLNRFMARYASSNIFVRLVVRTDGVEKRYPSCEFDGPSF